MAVSMLQQDRRTLEAAIKSLELSLHENTSDQETLAAVMAFRRKAKGQPLSHIAQALFSGRYDGRTLPEYREEWAVKFTELLAENHGLIAQVRELSRSENQLRILLAKAVAEERAAIDAKLRAETRLKEAKDEAKRTERAAQALVRTASRIKPNPDRPKRKPRGPCPAPVEFLTRDPEHKPTKGAKWDAKQREYLISLYQENPDYSNQELQQKMNDRFGNNRTENAIKGTLNRLRDQGLLTKYRPGYERDAA